jgi:hypothetical protein
MLGWARAVGVAMVMAASLLGAASAWEPPRGSPERAAILDALRPMVEDDVGPPVVFLVSRINAEHGYAFVSATPQRPGDVPIDWSRTRFAEAFAADAMSDMVLALLSDTGGGWQVLEYAIGPTDVVWEEWIEKYRLPRRLFDPTGE